MILEANGTLLTNTLRHKKSSRPPFWFMRQAGRSLPEYRELRSKYDNFMDFCYTPEAAAEATLQPVTRFDMDAAIIFSDILVIPHALGQQVTFIANKGPVLSAIRSKDDIKSLTDLDTDRLKPVYEAIKLTRGKLDKSKALIGFAGAPWTLLCYMIEGGSSRNFSEVKAFMQQEEKQFSRLVDKLVDAVAIHASNQIKAGVDVFQLFDSWAGILNAEDYAKWVIAPAQRIIGKIKTKHPKVPVIAFPRQSGSKFLDYAKQSQADAISVDDSVSLDWVQKKLQPEITVQGLLSPESLAGNKDAMLKEAAEIVASLQDKPFVFNLGHGILPHTPLENIHALCHYLKDVRLN